MHYFTFKSFKISLRYFKIEFLFIRYNQENIIMATMYTFTTIYNAINNIEIIINDVDGYYNITKINNQIKENNKKFKNNQKKVGDWFNRKSNKDLIDEAEEELDNNKLYYDLHAGVEDKYRGIYVHKILYDHILMWIDSKYAIKISKILSDMHEAKNIDLFNKNVSLGEQLNNTFAKMDKQSQEYTKKIDDQGFQINALIGLVKKSNIKIDGLSKETAALLDYAEKADKTNEALVETVNDLNEKLDEAKDDLNEIRTKVIDQILPHIVIPTSNKNNLPIYMISRHNTNENDYLFFAGQTKNSKTFKSNEDFKIAIVEATYTPAPDHMFTTLRTKINKFNLDIKEQINSDYRAGKYENFQAKKKIMDEIKINLPIKLGRNTININPTYATFQDVQNMINDYNNDKMNFM